MEWVLTVVVLVLVIVLMDSVRMVQSPKREVGSRGTGLIRCALHIATFVAYSTMFRLRGNKNKFRTLVFDTLRFVQMTASPDTIRIGLNVVTFIFNTIIWRSNRLIRQYVLVPFPENMSFISALRLCKANYKVSDIEVCVIYIHGGGYFCGNEKMYLPAHEKWIESCEKTEILCVDYALSNHSLAMQQCREVLLWYVGLYPNRKVILAGDSAGACIAFRLAMRYGSTLEALIMISPWIVQDTRASSFRKNRHSDYLTTEFVQIASSLHGLNKTDPVVSPLFCTLGAFRNVPRTLLVWGEDELFRDDCMSFASRLTREGVSVTISRSPNKPHVWVLLYPWLYSEIEAIGTIREIASFCFVGDDGRR